MINLHRDTNQSMTNDLRQVIEPLASYICAASQPRAALLAALATLRNEVAKTNLTARQHLSAKK